MKNKKKLRALVWFSLVGAITIVVTINLKKNFQGIEKSFNEEAPDSYTLSSSDSLLFKKESFKYVKVLQVKNNKKRRPLSILTVNDKFDLFLYCLDTSRSQSLKDLVTIEQKDMDRSVGITYNIIEKENYKFEFQSGSPTQPLKIFITVDSGPIQSFTNSDSTLNYNFLSKNLSIRYAHNMPIDIYLRGNQIALGEVKKMPIDLNVVIKNGKTYLFILISEDDKTPVPIGLLNNILS